MSSSRNFIKHDCLAVSRSKIVFPKKQEGELGSFEKRCKSNRSTLKKVTSSYTRTFYSPFFIVVRPLADKKCPSPSFWDTNKLLGTIVHWTSFFHFRSGATIFGGSGLLWCRLNTQKFSFHHFLKIEELFGKNFQIEIMPHLISHKKCSIRKKRKENV